MAGPDVGPVLNIDNWHYRAEGSSSFVIFNPKIRRILKLRKTDARDSSQKVCDEDWTLCHDYVKTLIQPILGSKFICLPKMIPTTRKFLEAAIQRFGHQRPEKRRGSQIDVNKSYVLSFPDFCFLPSPEKTSDNPTFSIEIKPKKGFLPVSHHIPDDLAIKYSVCRVCLHQHHKVQNGVWEHHSQYCPLDLFSCDPPRMKYCLNMLLRNPQNNFRICKDGVLIYQVFEKSTPSLQEQQDLVNQLKPYFGDGTSTEMIEENPLESSCVQAFLDVLIRTLLSNNVQNGITHHVSSRPSLGAQFCKESGYKTKDSFQTSVKAEGIENCILQRLLAAQSLSVLEIDEIYPLYLKVLKYLEEHPEDSHNYILDFPYGGTFNYADGVHLGISNNGSNGKKLDLSNVSIKDAVQLIREFLITRTVKDCSIMVAAQLVDENYDGGALCMPNGKSYLHSAVVIDLDPKPSSRIPTYERTDRKIAQEYLSHSMEKTGK
ncbi:inositol-pentakisphosphate 2-kinase-like [Asterias rubens]|uniref:inositol-pentakisphosphate 2-kinase-like n=1 Tax=Asterias rubens TaxID=7604 RepID=UPI001455D4C0|nr:inositol-pentakisphosphate 2-kinase-like [Asterias rubens]